MDRYIDSSDSKRWAAAADQSSKVMLLNILKFLKARPAALFESPPANATDADSFYQQRLEPIITVLSVADEDLRALAQPLAQELYQTGTLTTLRKTIKPISSEYRAQYRALG